MLFSRILERLRIDPAVRIVHVTPRVTRTSNAADQMLLHASHTALAMANGICHEIVSRRLVDREFVSAHVAFKTGRTNIGYEVPVTLAADAPGEATWQDYVAFLDGQSVGRAAEVAGVPVEQLRWLASVYGDPTKNVLSIWGGDTTRHARGVWTSNALYNIHLLVGKIGRPGNGALCLTGQPSGACAVHTAGAAPAALPRGIVTNPADRARAAAIWGIPETRVDPRPGPTLLEMLRAFDRGDIRFLWIQSTNPMVSVPHLDRYRRAAAKEGRFLVVSEVYPTATSDAADVILPAAMWMEREGVFANVERRAQHFEQMIAPPGDAMSDAWQMIEVARRLGLGSMFPANRRTHVAELWEEYRRFHDDAETSLPSFELLRSRPGVMWPFVGGNETSWRYATASDPAANKSRGNYDFYGHPDGRAWIWMRPFEAPVESPTPDFPFWLRTGPVLEHWGTGSMTRRVPSLHRSAPAAYVELNREDAARLGIRNFERVRLVSRRSAVEIEARIDYRTQPRRNEVFAPTFDEDVLVNRLFSDAGCPISGQPDAATCAVRVERIAGKAGA